jgi:hypothetical protein
MFEIHNKPILTGILAGAFDPIGLGEMESVQLMNRTDTKYIFSLGKLAKILEQASGKYNILEINQQRLFQYSTTYLDTPDYYFYYQQATGRLQRHKVRFRTYESTRDTYLEVKRKTNKNRTLKWRIKKEMNHAWCDEEAVRFLGEFIPQENTRIHPVLTNRFTRLTLVGLQHRERITIDYGLNFKDAEGITAQLPSIAIAELKREGFTNQSPFISLMKQFGIRPAGFSKYCVGSAILFNRKNSNRLKQKFLLLNKIENEYHEFIAGKNQISGVGNY